VRGHIQQVVQRLLVEEVTMPNDLPPKCAFRDSEYRRRFGHGEFPSLPPLIQLLKAHLSHLL
jgi:hypothetical protein